MPVPHKRPDALDVQPIADFLYTSSLYAGKTDVEKRRLIKTKLDDYNFAINPNTFSEASLRSSLGNYELPSEIQFPSTIEGVAVVKAHYDGTTKTGRIKQGRPVCFDMTTGNCVTGIDDTWGADEYKVVGIALFDYQVVNTIGLTAIRLIPAAAQPAEVYATCVASLTTTLEATATDASNMKTASGTVYAVKKTGSNYGWSAIDPPAGSPAPTIVNPYPFEFASTKRVPVRKHGSLWTVGPLDSNMLSMILSPVASNPTGCNSYFNSSGVLTAPILGSYGTEGVQFEVSWSLNIQFDAPFTGPSFPTFDSPNAQIAFGASLYRNAVAVQNLAHTDRIEGYNTPGNEAFKFGKFGIGHFFHGTTRVELRQGDSLTVDGDVTIPVIGTTAITKTKHIKVTPLMLQFIG